MVTQDALIVDNCKDPLQEKSNVQHECNCPKSSEQGGHKDLVYNMLYTHPEKPHIRGRPFSGLEEYNALSFAQISSYASLFICL